MQALEFKGSSSTIMLESVTYNVIVKTANLIAIIGNGTDSAILNWRTNRMYLYHYYDKEIGPFKNLSDLSSKDAKEILRKIAITKPTVQCAKRQADYMQKRAYYEEILRSEFAKKGGIISRKSPHYMVVENSPWLSTWYENSSFIKISIEKFDLRTISFTYGDSHPTFSDRVNDGKEYRKKLYTYDEILQIIEKYGLPQEWNNDGQYGSERYIEAHIWSDDVINNYLNI